jgi:HlyD family secretion protein
VLLTIILWGVFGQIATTVEVSGTLTLSNPVEFVPATAIGQVTGIAVQPGSEIQAGDEIAVIATADGNVPVQSPHNGRVLSVRAGVGDPIDVGAPLISLESFDREQPRQEVVLYVSLEDQQHIRTGMEAQVLPSTVEREKYGYLEGRIVSIARFAATRDEMLVVLGDAGFVADLTAAGPVFEVRIMLDTDDDGFVWSASEGPSAPIVSGTPALVTINVDQERPISRILNLLS